MKITLSRALLLGTAVLFLFTGLMPAQSADGDAATAPSTTSARKAKTSGSDTWNGFYAGGYAGFGMRRATANTTTVFSPTGYFASSSVPAIASSGRQNLNSNNFNGGGTVGYNHQSGSWVVGAEADFGSLTGTKSVTTTTTYPCCSPSTFTVTQSAKTTWLFTARPRVGYTWGNTMAYLTGGLAMTRLNYQARFSDNFPTAPQAGAAENGGLNKTITGWTGGGGLETKVNDHWSVKGEYLYAQFSRQTTTSTNLTAFTPSVAFPSNVFTHGIFLKEHLVRFGFNYHF